MRIQRSKLLVDLPFENDVYSALGSFAETAVHGGVELDLFMRILIMLNLSSFPKFAA